MLIFYGVSIVVSFVFCFMRFLYERKQYLATGDSKHKEEMVTWIAGMFCSFTPGILIITGFLFVAGVSWIFLEGIPRIIIRLTTKLKK